MPYIKPEDRGKYSIALSLIRDEGIMTKGELEYLICSLQDAYMRGRDFRYSTLHDCCYATQHAADEFRRRFLDLREHQALEENGDVFLRMKRRFDI